MEKIYFLLLIFILLEFFESSWHRANSMYELIKKNYLLYKKSIFYFFFINITFIYTLFLLVSLESLYSSGKFIFWITTILGMKMIDIIFKLFLFKRIDSGVGITQFLPNDIAMSYSIRYSNILFYPTMFYFGTL